MIHPIIYLFPYCALSARYKEDSGDGDEHQFDYIDDVISQWDPEARVLKFKTKLDFAYLVANGTSALIVIRGTEGKAWFDNFSPFPLREDDAHDGFYDGAEALYVAMKDEIKYFHDITITGQSRGGALAPALAEIIYKDTGVKSFVVTYSAPPVYTRKGKKRFEAIGIEGYRVINPRDIVDNAGRPLLKHVLETITLPFAGNVLNRFPVIGWLIGGHAYTSIFDGLYAWSSGRKNSHELQYLRESKGVCTI
jgi:hypothetical protein